MHIKKILVINLLLTLSIFGQVKFSGNTNFEVSNDRKASETYFENWTELTASYKMFRAGLRYEAHMPPQSYSPEKEDHGLYQRFIEFQNKYYHVTLGNFYTMLGRGLVLRSFENRTLRWDTNIDGVHAKFSSKFIDAKAFSGQPRDRVGNRLKALHGGEIKIKPVNMFHFGGTFLQTKTLQNEDINWGSGYAKVEMSYGSFYGEYANRAKIGLEKEGKAIYLAGDLFIKDLALRGEYKNYDNFHLARGEYYDYNNPPTVVREHLYTLLNRHQHQINSNNEIGYLLEASYPVLDIGVFTTNFNRTTDQKYIEAFKEYYAQFEMDFPEDWNWVFAGGHEKDRASRYLNFVNSTSWSFSDYNSIKVIYEHQHEKKILTDRQFYSQILLLSFARAPYFTFSLIGERTTEQYLKKSNWFGAQVDVQFKQKYDLTLFAGTRREGKICAGGVCVYKPEFEGVELIFTARL